VTSWVGPPNDMSESCGVSEKQVAGRR